MSDIIEPIALDSTLQRVASALETMNQNNGDTKADKVTDAVAGNFAGLDVNGNLIDSGKKASDYLTPNDISGKLDAPETAGTVGQHLRVAAGGGVEWASVGEPSDLQVETAVEAWLDDHPEATTTVEDGSITRAKLDSTVGGAVDDVSDLKSALNNILDETTELLTGTKTNAKTIISTGAVIDAAASYYVNTYSVTAGDELVISGCASNYGYLYIFTDNSDNIVGQSEQNGAGQKNYSDINALVPSQAVSLIVASHDSAQYTQAKVEKVIYSVKGIYELNTQIEALEEHDESIDGNFTEILATADAGENIIIHDGYYISILGTDTGPYQNWQYGEFAIPSNTVSLIVTGKAGQSARLWQLQDSSGSVLAYSDYSGSAKVFSETINLSSYPTGTKVFVNDQKSDSIAITYTYKKKVVDGEKVYIDGNALPSILGYTSDKLYGKVLCCAGDSITYGADMDAEGITNASDITVYNCDSNGDFTQTTSNFLKTWGWQIASRHSMTFYNGGISGSTMQGISERNGFSLANGRYTKLPDNIDYLLIWFGWNDYAAGTLGAITDSTNESYYGGYNVVLPYLINKYPYAKIGLIVPFGASAGHREAIRLLGNKWGLAVWDNYQGGTPLYFGKETSVGVDADVATANRTKFQANGAHPNYKGHTQLADMIEEWLKGI